MSNAVFGKTVENIRKLKYIKLITTDAKPNCLLSEPDYHKTFFFSEKLLWMEMKKKQTNVFINKLTYLGLAILEISKTPMYEFCHE